jgi:tripartite-type tricarboxylate transporter receptor subunit TctC
MLPDVPTLVESGYPDLISSTWNALSAPPGTPPTILNRLNTAIEEVLQDKSVQSRFADLQMSAVGGSLADTKAEIEKERQQWGAVVRAARIEAQ